MPTADENKFEDRSFLGPVRKAGSEIDKIKQPTKDLLGFDLRRAKNLHSASDIKCCKDASIERSTYPVATEYSAVAPRLG